MKLFGNDVMKPHSRSHDAYDVLFVVLCKVVCRVFVITTHVEQHMQQIALRISSEKYVEQFGLCIFEENGVLDLF